MSRSMGSDIMVAEDGDFLVCVRVMVMVVRVTRVGRAPIKPLFGPRGLGLPGTRIQRSRSKVHCVQKQFPRERVPINLSSSVILYWKLYLSTALHIDSR